MLALKMMGAEDKSDSDCSKSFRIITVEKSELVAFCRDENGLPLVKVSDLDGFVTTWYPEGNTYVMNETGKTIATFSHMY